MGQITGEVATGAMYRRGAAGVTPSKEEKSESFTVVYCWVIKQPKLLGDALG